jgi:hypothetical protein
VFQKFCSWIWVDEDGGRIAIIPDTYSQEAKEFCASYGSLTRLSWAGLVTFSGQEFFVEEAETVTLSYGGEKYVLRPRQHKRLPVGVAFLTVAGAELSRVISAEPQDKIKSCALRYWRTGNTQVEQADLPPTQESVTA